MKWRLCAIYKFGTHRQTDIDTPWTPVGAKKYVSYIFFIAHYIPFLYLACSVVKWWWLSVKVSRTIIINIKPWNEQNNNETCPKFDCHMFIGAGVLWDWGAPHTGQALPWDPPPPRPLMARQGRFATGLPWAPERAGHHFCSEMAFIVRLWSNILKS